MMLAWLSAEREYLSRMEFTAKLAPSCARADLVESLPIKPPQDRQRELCRRGFARLVGAVAQGHVRDFMGQDARQLRLVVGRFDHARLM